MSVRAGFAIDLAKLADAGRAITNNPPYCPAANTEPSTGRLSVHRATTLAHGRYAIVVFRTTGLTRRLDRSAVALSRIGRSVGVPDAPVPLGTLT
jgi:hypothetical protein